MCVNVNPPLLMYGKQNFLKKLKRDQQNEENVIGSESDKLVNLLKRDESRVDYWLN